MLPGWFTGSVSSCSGDVGWEWEWPWGSPWSSAPRQRSRSSRIAHADDEQAAQHGEPGIDVDPPRMAPEANRVRKPR